MKFPTLVLFGSVALGLSLAWAYGPAVEALFERLSFVLGASL